MIPRRAARRAVRALLLASCIAAFTIAGMVVGLATGSNERHRASFGTVDTRMRADLDGHLAVYVPLVDWRVRVLEHRVPVRVELELRGIDRDQAEQSISSAGAANESLRELRAESAVIVERALRRGLLAGALGGLAGALVAGAFITSTRLRRRWLLISPAIGAVIVASVLVPSAAELRTLDPDEARLTASGGYASELPMVLRFARQLLDAGDEYEQHYATAMRSVANVAELAGGEGGGAAAEVDRVAYVVSDFHDNVFVLDAFAELVEDSQVFAVGDFVQVGARVTERHADRIAALGSGVVAVSGNHDTSEYMDALREAGATVLDDAQPTVDVGGLLVAGYPDPLERRPGSRGEHRLRVYGAEYDGQRADVLAWWDQLPERPDVVLIHQHGFAHALLAHLEEEGDDDPLLVLTGHDHEPHVHVAGAQAIVDAGTLGAGGLAAVGEQAASFVRLEFAGGVPVAARVIEVEPLTGRATSERFELSSAAGDGR